MRLLKPVLYLWASPNSFVGLVLIPLAVIGGGGVQIVDGVLEAYGGRLTLLLRRPFWISGPISAMYHRRADQPHTRLPPSRASAHGSRRDTA